MTEETQRKGNICATDYSMKVMNNHAGNTLTRPAETAFSHIKVFLGGGLSRVPETEITESQLKK